MYIELRNQNDLYPRTRLKMSSNLNERKKDPLQGNQKDLP